MFEISEEDELRAPSTLPFADRNIVITSAEFVPLEMRRDLINYRRDRELSMRIINQTMPEDSPLHMNANTAGLCLSLFKVFAPKFSENCYERADGTGTACVVQTDGVRFSKVEDDECCIVLTEGVANDAQLNTLLWWMRECMETGFDDLEEDEENQMDTDEDATEQSDWQDDDASSNELFAYHGLPALFPHPLDPPRTTQWRLLSPPPSSESVTTTLLPLLGITIALGIPTARNDIIDMLRDIVRERPLQAHELEALRDRFKPTDKLLHRILSCIGERFSRQHAFGADERAFLNEHRRLLEIVLHVADFERIRREKSYLFGRAWEDLDTIVEEARNEKIWGWLQGLHEEQEEPEKF
ncbi:hypothetical protein BKA80DRAFT_261917 [Phyllosticta citrichinensis]